MTRQNGQEFDFLLGAWNVCHRRLQTRLARADDWQEFGGHCHVYPILDGLGNMDDNYLELPKGAYHAISLRTFDPETSQWAIWWLDGRNPHHMDVPVKGGFSDGKGSFLAEDLFEERPVLVRFEWTRVETLSPRWEQAFSGDQGMNWEVNWSMDFTRP